MITRFSSAAQIFFLVLFELTVNNLLEILFSHLALLAARLFPKKKAPASPPPPDAAKPPVRS